MSAGHQQVFNKVFIFNCRCRLAHTTATLSLIIAQRLGLGIAAIGNGDNTVFFGNQVFNSEVVERFNDLSATLIAKLFNHCFELFTNNRHQTSQVTENILILGNLFKLDGKFSNNFIVFHTG